MHLIELHIHKFLQQIQKGGYKIPKDLLEKFSESTGAHLKRQFEREPREFTLRMSNIGRPLCILQMEQKHGNRASEIQRFLLGDIVEDITLFLIHASGIKVVAEQKPVKLNIAGTTIDGTLDVILDLGNGPEIYDIKSASEYSFKTKLKQSLEDFIAADTFGYFNQLLGYAAAEGIPAGGFVFVNKSSGELKVISIPKDQQQLQEKSQKNISENIKAFADKTPFKRQFPDVKEIFRKKDTGNRHLGITCSFCDYKFECWENLQLQPQSKSVARDPKLIFYTEYHEDKQ